MRLRTIQPSIVLTLMLSVVSCSLAACTTAVGSDKVPQSVWPHLTNGKPQNLIVEFDDAANKRAVLSALPSNEVEVLKNYETLPLMHLRFHTSSALKALLANPSVVKAYEDRQENMLPQQRAKP